MRNVIIYRHLLHKSSETFIYRQAQALQKFNPICVGRKNNSRVTAILHSVFRAGELRQKIAAATPALIHAHFGIDAVYAMPIAKKLGLPLITTFHGSDATMTKSALLTSMRPAYVNYLLFRKKLAEVGDVFLCSSEFVKQKVINLGFPEQRVYRHYIGTDVQENALIEHNMRENIILHVARLDEVKGTEYLLYAFAKVVKNISDIILVIIGDGPLRKKLMSLCVDLKIEENVKFLGMLPHRQVLDFMKIAKVFCLPCIHAKTGQEEGLSTVIMEAGVRALPVIATRTGGIPEVVVDGQTGLLVPEKDSSMLANKLLYLLGDDKAASIMGDNARKFICANFDLKKQTEKLEKIYESVL